MSKQLALSHRPNKWPIIETRALGPGLSVQSQPQSQVDRNDCNEPNRLFGSELQVATAAQSAFESSTVHVEKGLVSRTHKAEPVLASSLISLAGGSDVIS